jgi:hypothetical protein
LSSPTLYIAQRLMSIGAIGSAYAGVCTSRRSQTPMSERA